MAKKRKPAQNYHLGSLLDPETILQAKKDILRCRLKDRERDTLLKTIGGVKASELAKIYHLHRQNIYHIRKTALVKIRRELGSREWIRKESKGMIEDWNITFPKGLTDK
jgi:hypothetical protein